MKIQHLSLGLLLAIAAPFAAASDARPTAQSAALDRYYRLTFGRQIEQLDYDAMVDKFRAGASSRPDVQSCPALKTTISDFSQNQFRKALVAYMTSPALEKQIKDRLAASLTQQDLEAYLAFVDTPAGAKYLEHSQAAIGSVEALMSEAPEAMMESPEMKAMLGEMMTTLLPVMLKCPK